MSNNIYDSARYQLLTAQLDWTTIPLVLSAWNGPPEFVPTDQTVNDITGRGFTEVGHSLTITGQTVTANGTAQTNPVLIPGVAVGNTVTWFTMSRKHATVHELSQLILFIDEADGFPFDANGLDILVQPDWLEERGWWRP